MSQDHFDLCHFHSHYSSNQKPRSWWTYSAASRPYFATPPKRASSSAFKSVVSKSFKNLIYRTRASKPNQRAKTIRGKHATSKWPPKIVSSLEIPTLPTLHRKSIPSPPYPLPTRDNANQTDHPACPPSRKRHVCFTTSIKQSPNESLDAQTGTLIYHHITAPQNLHVADRYA